jgi:hypothetical protein
MYKICPVKFAVIETRLIRQDRKPTFRNLNRLVIVVNEEDILWLQIGVDEMKLTQN